MNKKLNYTSLLIERQSFLVDSYYRLITKKIGFTSIPVVLKQLISKFFIDYHYKLYKLIDLITCQQICKDRHFIIAKCFSIQNWNNCIKIFLSAYQSSFKTKYMLNFNPIHLKCDVFHQKATSETKFVKQIDCRVCDRGLYPKNGQLLKFLVHFYNVRGSIHDKYVMEVSILDASCNDLAKLTSIIRGRNIQNTSLYLEWDNVIKVTSSLPSYQNGMLSIEAFPKDYQSQSEIITSVKREDWDYFDYDYILKSRDE